MKKFVTLTDHKLEVRHLFKRKSIKGMKQVQEPGYSHRYTTVLFKDGTQFNAKETFDEIEAMINKKVSNGEDK